MPIKHTTKTDALSLYANNVNISKLTWKSSFSSLFGNLKSVKNSSMREITTSPNYKKASRFEGLFQKKHVEYIRNSQHQPNANYVSESDVDKYFTKFLNINYVGQMEINNQWVDVKKSPWDNSYQIGNESRLTFQKELVDNINGIITFRRRNDETAFGELYQQWHQGDVSLIRGISSSHFSWNEIVTDAIVRSEGERDLPRATEGMRKGTCWLPTAMDSEINRMMVGGIALGNHIKKVKDAIRDENTAGSVIAGGILKFTAGRNRQLNINFLYDGEVVVQGPIKQPDFIIDKLITGDGGTVDVSHLRHYGEYLPLAAPYLALSEDQGSDRYKLSITLGEAFLKDSERKLTRIRASNSNCVFA